MAISVQYDRNSPYFLTQFYGDFLDVSTFPTIPAEFDDVLFTINKTYQFRPDLLAYDLYGDAGLWWVFALRNPDYIEDPIFDMNIGRRIFLPKKTSILSVIR
jgi:Base plate wedge protein 53